jgi:EmrB/QacA subfamily drug resistance transporter
MSTELSEQDSTRGQGASAAWGLILVAIVGAEFMLQLDGTIVNVALPTLQDKLTLGVTTASWVPNGFLLAFGGLLLLSGRLGDVLGHRRVFLYGIALVVVASLVAGLAPNVPVLIAGRVLQGAGAALAGPAGLALLSSVFEGARLQRAFGLYSTVTGLGAAAGMVLGGILTHVGDWRWSLLVNVPMGLIILIAALRTLGTQRGTTHAHSLGLASAVLATASLVLLVFGLVSAASQGWGSSTTIATIVAGALVAALMLVVDRRAKEPLLPKPVFANRDRATSFISLVLLASVLTGFLLYLVQYLRDVLRFNALESGLGILPFGLGLLVVTQLLTPKLGKIDLKVRAVAGLVLVLLGVGWLTQLDGASTYYTGVLPQIVLMGLGVGLAIVPINMTILTTVRPEDSGITAGLLQTSLTIGGVLGVAVLLIPYTGGDGRPAETVSTLFLWSSAIIAIAIVVLLVGWFARPKPASANPDAGQNAEESAA